MARFNYSEVHELTRDFFQAEMAVKRGGRDVAREAAGRLQRDWRENAKDTAGSHGKLYPRTIGFDGPTQRGTGRYVATVGPDASLPQGGMSFEFGSINQDPHLDGNRAADGELTRFALAALELGYGELRVRVER
jgi:hypothetical protein